MAFLGKSKHKTAGTHKRPNGLDRAKEEKTTATNIHWDCDDCTFGPLPTEIDIPEELVGNEDIKRKEKSIMGYYASYSGSITTKPMSREDERTLLEHLGERCTELQELNRVDAFSEGFEVEVKSQVGDKSVFEILMTGYGKYHSDDVYRFLYEMTPYTEEGEIEMQGEDYEAWRFHFRNGTWYEDSGYVAYVESEAPIHFGHYVSDPADQS